MASADLRIDSPHTIAPQRHLRESAFAAATTIVVVAAFAVLIGLLFQPSLGSFAGLWQAEPTYPFGFLIPALSLAMAACTWRRSGAPLRYDVARADLRAGAFVLLLGLAAHAASLVVGNVQLDVAALVLIVRGTVRICGGREMQKAYEPTTLILLFMIPVSLDFITPIAAFFVRCTAFGSGALLDLVGVPVYVDGALISLRDYAMTVSPATCGLRELQGTLAVCLAAGFISGRSRPFVLILALLSLPIAAGVSALRFTTAGVIHHWRDRAAAEQFLNSFDGATSVTVAVGLVVVTTMGLMGLASLIPSRKSK